MKIDLKRELAGYAARRGEFALLTIDPRRYLMLDGSGNPNRAPRYEQVLATIFPVAYALKFLSKNELGRDYVVPPLEGLWWAEDMTTFLTREKSRWSWTMLSLVPDWIDDALVDTARATAAGKGAPLVDELRVETLDEGLCVQTLHVGPYDDEGPVLQGMHTEFIADAGLSLTGRHHEIYLSDPRRTDPSRLRTILRQPVTDA